MNRSDLRRHAYELYAAAVSFCERHGAPMTTLRIYGSAPLKTQKGQPERRRSISWNGRQWLEWREELPCNHPEVWARLEFDSLDDAFMYGFGGCTVVIGMQSGTEIKEPRKTQLTKFIEGIFKSREVAPSLSPGEAEPGALMP